MYSVIIPCYKSSQTIGKVVEMTSDQLESMGIKNYEFILANDCSPDDGKTIDALRALATKHNYVKVIDLGKNNGQHNAVMACLNYASGDFIISMDDDMQTHPSQIPALIDKINEGFDLVYGYYEEKKESIFRRFGSFVNYQTVRLLIGKPKWLKTSSFWIMRKYIRDYAIQYKNHAVHLQGVFLRLTDNIACVPIKHFEREVGKSTYTLRKLIKLYDNILIYSSLPAKIIFSIGAFLTFVGLILAVFFSVMHFKSAEVIGIGELIISYIILFVGIIQLSVGMVAKKIDSIADRVSNKPQYVVKKTYNMEES